MPRSLSYRKKKYFSGNQYVKHYTEPKCTSPAETVSSEGSSPRLTPQCNPRPMINTTPSSSKKKLSYLQSDACDIEQINNGCSNVNVIVDVEFITSLISESCKCKYCGSEGTLSVFENEEKRKGLVTSLVLECSKCKVSRSQMTSNIIPKTKSRLYETNLRFVYAMRDVGVGVAGSRAFCAIMNLPPPPLKFVTHIKALLDALEPAAEESMNKAAREVVEENSGENKIAAAFDGTWQKRGHTSLNGIVSATSFDTGKVIDLEVLSKYCQGCTKNPQNKGTHIGCVRNYEGSSGGMESAGILNIFQRSEAKRKLQYVKFLGDGDSSAFDTVKDAKPYGDKVTLEKLECIGHIQKRMGSRLRRLKTKSRGITLKDGKKLAGKGRLTDAQIDLLQSYYGLAIRRNVHDVKAMNKAVWAIYFHKLSTDENPQHGLCPKGPESWCKFQKAKITGEVYKHKSSLPAEVLLYIKQIFRDLSKEELLGKCVHGKTQNPNESLNHLIWSKIPKRVFVGYNTLKCGALDAVLTFNDGAMAKSKVLINMGVKVGKNTLTALRKIDMLRVQKAEKASQEVTKEARVKRRQMKRKNEDQEAEEAPQYGPGEF